ncbi:MAG: SET domain-containing protein-lysine N-methyltransferase [Candidatus Krumholzibacteria bacterium]|nr:SET domain-containing protein-lysine N-methyltransferase [Candidatus Krumholzibacteria bacterium]MDH4335867.1 SET domain-containing protein-lysine N-methyltransferase [Candidatus Krumholzibacteria bacterium]MDH5270359.1 SET domain-containing protein-lysine N-methyltransferase [Candidatus Krumholzibacteria bacterium]MDH5626724.1 SET domain-containing protein-lysine N-methyltransferase [Candidatus Krumholzibacteria bacterium]
MASKIIVAQPTGFVSPRLEGKLIAGKGGRGVFARERVRAGELLVVWGGEVVDGDTLRSMSVDRFRLALQVEEGLYLLTTHEGPADWVNHSCAPNAGMQGQVVLVAMRDIRAGEEITFDYAMSDGSTYDEFECRCGARTCRGRMNGSDWSLPELQERYAGYFSPYLQRRIDAARANGGKASARRLAAERRVGVVTRRS